MTYFIFLLFIGMDIARGDIMGHEKMKEQWFKSKALESCFGEDMMKIQMVKMKNAVVKCNSTELDLPRYKSLQVVKLVPM